MSRIPKQIAGVRVPKELRRPAETLLGLASHPIVSDTIAAALVAGSAALAERKSRADVGKAAGIGAAAAAVKASNGANRVAIALAVAAAQLLVAELTHSRSSKAKRKKAKSGS